MKRKQNYRWLLESSVDNSHISLKCKKNWRKARNIHLTDIKIIGYIISSAACNITINTEFI